VSDAGPIRHYAERPFKRPSAASISNEGKDHLQSPVKRGGGSTMKILVPVDSSEFAFKALEKAIEMAKQLGAQLTIMSVAAQFEGVAEEVRSLMPASSRTRRKSGQ